MREATVHVPDEKLKDLGLGAFVSTVRAAGLRRVAELKCRRPGCLLVVELAEPIDGEALGTLDEVLWWERIDGTDGTTYLCKLAVGAFGEGLDPHHRSPVTERDVAATDDGIDLTMIGAQEDLSDRVADYDDTVGVVLRSLGRYEGPEGVLDALTERQREVLVTAFDSGYFAIPREATAEKVAADLGLEPATVREHLQRAQRNLMTALLDGG